MTAALDCSRIPALLRGPVLVSGAGVSGRGIVRLLLALGVKITLADSSETARNAFAEEGVLGLDPDSASQQLEQFSVVVTSPGWRPDSPLLLAAAQAGLEVIGDVELCYRLDRAGVFGKPRTWLVVTGTNGKTTTTAMLAAMMSNLGADSGLHAQAVGNIGISVADALCAEERVDVLVAELSSFQLHWSSELFPDAGVLLNLAEDHLNWHGSFSEYARAKAKVLRGPVAVAGIDDPEVRELAGTSTGFSAAKPKPGDFGVLDGWLVEHSPEGELIRLAPATGIEPSGPAGVLDALAAAALARSQGATAEHIAAALADFQVAKHRGQVVAQHQGVTWVDNSKATNPHAADSALAGLDSVIWIAGGQLKGADVTELIKAHAPRLKAAALLGVDAPLIEQALSQHAGHVALFRTQSSDPQEAMEQVVTFAANHAASGDTVVLAPAAASLDMYTGMGQRGDLFAAAARNLAHTSEGPHP